MFTISQPVFEKRNGKSRMTSAFTAPGFDKEIFFETEEQYGQYLTYEVADAFVVAAMLPALMAGEDIEAPRVSSDLAYHFDTLMYLFGKVFDCPPVKLHAHEVVDTDFRPQAVGTGFSGGVDSMCTYVRHTADTCPESMRVTHLALFNVGAYGNDYDNTTKSFKRDLERARVFAQEVGKPLVPLDSNISSICTHMKIHYYSPRTPLYISSGVLALQKLFKTYYISSGHTIDLMKLSADDQTQYEASITQRLSNKHTSIFIADHDLTRLQKTKILAYGELARKHLYVCLADIIGEQTGTSLAREDAPNCTECFKCLRTVCTLDSLGVLADFSSRFDIAKWGKLKEKYLVDIYLNRGKDLFMKENWEFFVETGHELTPAQMAKVREAEEECKRANRARQPHLSTRTCLRILGGKVLRRLGLKK